MPIDSALVGSYDSARVPKLRRRRARLVRKKETDLAIANTAAAAGLGRSKTRVYREGCRIQECSDADTREELRSGKRATQDL